MGKNKKKGKQSSPTARPKVANESICKVVEDIWKCKYFGGIMPSWMHSTNDGLCTVALLTLLASYLSCCKACLVG